MTADSLYEMHIPLSHILREGFDYDAFTAAINADASLAEAIKQTAITSFNPKRELTINALAPKNALNGLIAPLQPVDHDRPHAGQLVPAEHPVCQMWQDAWQKALTFYAPEVMHYDLLMKRSDKQDYPYTVPEIRFTEAGDPTIAAITINTTMKLELSDQFMKLPPEQQHAILLHEANHGFEPVMQGIKPKDYTISRWAARSRRGEYLADNLADAWGEGGALAAGLQSITKASEKARIDYTSVYPKLHEAGFAIDPEKFSGAVMNQRREAEETEATMKALRVATGIQDKDTLGDRISMAYDALKDRREIQRTAKEYNRLVEGLPPRGSSHPDTPSRVAKLLDSRTQTTLQR